MIEKWIDPILEPFRRMRAKYRGVKNIKDNIKLDVKRVKQMGQNAKQEAADAAGKAKAMGGKVTGAAGQAQAAAGQAQGAAAGAAGQVQGGKKKMGLFGKKNTCATCGQPQDKTWDQCPFCMNAASAPPPAAGPPAGAPMGGGASANKTIAFMAGPQGGGATMQLLGWLVPLKGPHRGELHTLKPNSVIGKDPTQCDIVFNDPFMSSKHCSIKASNGVWILEDTSTNGTFVNDKKVKTHELVDNDFVKFGQTLIKFKSL
jgi:hypothetical protein